VTWQGGDVRLLPGATGSADRRGIHGLVSPPAEDRGEFEVALQLKGSSAIWFVPFARETRIDLVSNWRHPSFAGSWLPTERIVDAEGFTATWNVPFLGRDYPQSWTDAQEPSERISESRFGADLVTPIDPYRMSERSTKYAPLFLTLTFGLFWLVDTLVGVRVHPIQYLLVGAAMCLFYLLELSLSEHVGFLGAYFAAACGIVGLTTMYTKTVLGSSVRGGIVGGAMGGLYGYLLALLSLERYALLAGSLGLFAALGLVMYLTRWVDWDRVVRPERPADA
jgi:inner membrane protein